MRCRILALPLVLSALLGAQEAPFQSFSNGPLRSLIEFLQVTPGAGIREANSRGGWGGQLGIESGDVRFVLEAGEFPTQQWTLAGSPGSTYVLTMGAGFDYLFRITDQRDGSLYVLAGIHMDSWSGQVDSTQGREANHSSHLGLRMGAGLRLGPLFGEIRFRVTEGDIRVSSSYPGGSGVWGAVEVGMGIRF